jgi:signal-transduction protein with cAMP-binding, CBS, and nucleotidyltransferase domain
MDKIIVPLMRVAAFSGLTQEQFGGIARHAKKLKFLRGDVIIKAGTPGDGAFVIASGPAEREVAHGASAEIVPEGSLIGEMAMLTEHTYQSTVIARDWVFCLKITREGLHAQMREDPDLAEHFRRRVSERMLRVAEDLRRIDRLLAAEGRAAQQPASPDPGATEQLPAA